MKAFPFSLLVSTATLLCAAASFGQSEAPQQSGQPYVQDGGVNQTLESIFIPPMANAPFSCVLHTEWARTMPDGGTLSIVNQRKIARLSSGRFYQERWFLVPKNGSVESHMTHTQIADPNEHTLRTCFMGTHVCAVTAYGGLTSEVYKPEEPSAHRLPNAIGYVNDEVLGHDVKQNVDTVGTRITRVVNAWAIGNDRAFSITREFWFAPSIGINLVSRVSDPRFGSQTFTVTDLTLGEPDTTLFDMPSGFKLEDKRPASAEK